MWVESKEGSWWLVISSMCFLIAACTGVLSFAEVVGFGFGALMGN